MDLAQMAGWLAAAAAIIAMLQKSDLRLKQGLIIHTVLYGVHFALLGLPTAVVCDRAGSNHFVHLYEVPALRRRTDHHQHCDGACSFAIHRRNSSIGSERSIDAVFVSI